MRLTDRILSLGAVALTAGAIALGSSSAYAGETKVASLDIPEDPFHRIEYTMGLAADQIYDLRKGDKSGKKSLKHVIPKTLAEMVSSQIGIAARDDEKHGISYRKDNLILEYQTIINSAEDAGMDLTQKKIYLMLIALESGGYPFAISSTGAFGICQQTSWIYNKEIFNPFNPHEALPVCAKILKEDLDELGESLAIVTHYVGRDKMNTAITEAKAQGINPIKDPQKVLNIKKTYKNKAGKKYSRYVLPSGARQYYSWYTKTKRIVGDNWEENVLNPLNTSSREKYLSELKDSDSVYYLSTPKGEVVAFVPLEYTARKLMESENLEKYKRFKEQEKNKLILEKRVELAAWTEMINQSNEDEYSNDNESISENSQQIAEDN